MPTLDHTTLLASHHLLLGLADECLPVRVRPTGETSFFEDWEVTRAVLIARMAGTLRHLSYLAPSYSRLDGLALARTLVDHVITFAWISADPKERLPAFLRSSFKDMLAKDKRYREHGDAPLLGDAERERLRAYTQEVNQEMPKLPRRSGEADDNTTPAFSLTPADLSSSPAVSTIGSRLAVSSDSVEISAATTIWPGVTAAWAL